MISFMLQIALFAIKSLNSMGTIIWLYLEEINFSIILIIVAKERLYSFSGCIVLLASFRISVFHQNDH